MKKITNLLRHLFYRDDQLSEIEFIANIRIEGEEDEGPYSWWFWY